MSDISDPGRAGRGDRKRAQRLIDEAYAAGRLSAADRAFRSERVDAAHTKGDLAVIVRDLSRAAAAGAAAAPTSVVQPTTPPSPPTDPTAPPRTGSLGSAIPPDQLKAMSGKGGSSTIQLGEAMRSSMGAGAVKRARRIVLIVVIGFLLLCGLGIAGVVTAVFTGFSEITSSSEEPARESVNLQTAEGWRQLVAAIEDETGTTKVYDVVVYPEYASINAVADEGATRYVYRDGAFQLFDSPVTPAIGRPVDLARIDPDLVEGLPAMTAERQGMPEYDSAYLIVNRLTGRSAIMVYVQQSGRVSRWSIYSLEGEVIGGTPE